MIIISLIFAIIGIILIINTIIESCKVYKIASDKTWGYLKYSDGSEKCFIVGTSNGKNFKLCKKLKFPNGKTKIVPTKCKNFKTVEEVIDKFYI